MGLPAIKMDKATKEPQCHGTDGTHISGCMGWEAMRDAENERLRAALAGVVHRARG